MPDSIPLNQEILAEMTDLVIYNTAGERLGTVIQIPKRKMNNEPGYLILRSSSLMGRENRFFAIPATSQFIEVNKEGAPRLKITENELSCAKAVNDQRRPLTNTTFENSIYELLDFDIKDRDK